MRLTFSSIIAAVAALLLVEPGHALPNGAPKCAINQAVITDGHNAPSTGLFTAALSANTYMLQSKPETDHAKLLQTPGQKLTLTINGNNRPIFGLLMYATPGRAPDAPLAPNNVKQHVGVFSVPNGFRAQSAGPCNGFTQDAAESTITHANPNGKGNSLTFDWTAPAGLIGPITFNIVATNGDDNQPWEILNAITIDAATGGGAEAPAPAPAPAPTDAPAPTNVPAPAPAPPPQPTTPTAPGNGNDSDGDVSDGDDGDGDDGDGDDSDDDN
ncbi:hypothetical protein HDU85_000240 [Gaertneriomyces sp. JEL0708]|nr:hypothetical protein HDU85_000240 [Gaertneriomyces sp. JEL0708]